MKKIFYLLTVFLLLFISSIEATYSLPNKVQTTGDVLILGSLMANSADFQQKITSSGYSIKIITENEVDQISTTTGKTLIISGEKTLHPNVRKKTDEFLRSGGNIILAGTKAFDYSPIPHSPILVANLNNQNSYSIEKRAKNKSIIIRRTHNTRW